MIRLDNGFHDWVDLGKPFGKLSFLPGEGSGMWELVLKLLPNPTGSGHLKPRGSGGGSDPRNPCDMIYTTGHSYKYILAYIFW